MTNNYFVLQVWVSDFSWLFIDKAIEITGEAVEEVLQGAFDFGSFISSFQNSSSQNNSINPIPSEFPNRNLSEADFTSLKKDSISQNNSISKSDSNSQKYEKPLEIDFNNPKYAEPLAISPSSDNYKENPNSTFSSFIIRSQNPLDSVQSALLEYKSVIEKSFELQNPIIIKFESKTEKNEDWISKYKNAISPVCCGLFYVRPSWCESLDSIKNELLAQNASQDSIKEKNTKAIESNFIKSVPRIEIIIDPALAFGSGHHASTAGCLKFLSKIEKYLSFDKNIESDFNLKSIANLNSDSIKKESIESSESKCVKIPNLRGFEILDIGCGSGILSIAASKLGANVSACDVDEMALNATRSNASLNAVEFAHLWCGSINEKIPQNLKESQNANSIESEISHIKASLKNHFDIVLANIIADVLVSLPIVECAKNGALIILSGIINESAEMVIEHFKALNCELLEFTQEEGWTTILLKKQ